ncbi:MAG: NAD(P)-binding domain-containing protein [Alphaproteobacteria bacterium]|nr:NAD(P)-binding domain-containing protein [Alphaproteobacteria bacterium]
MPISPRVVDPRLPKTCIIGAGSSGIAAAKVLAGAGIPFDCIEKSDRVGGNWVFKNKNEVSSAYRSLHINTSRDKMAYSDFPLPRSFPDYPHHAQIAQYFDSYVDHFGIRERILFNTGVKRAEQSADGLWKVEFDSGEQRLYDALIVANGHHWDPRWPEPMYPGRFDGKQIHSHQYIDPYDPVSCVGRNVLVVGFGNSALDLACELGRKGVAKNVYLSQRRGYWVIPKYTAGKVLDAQSVHPSQDPPWWQRMMPFELFRWLAERQLAATAGRPEQYGLPKPDHPLLSTHPAVSQELYIRVGSGDIKPKPDIKDLRGRQASFVDGTLEDIDVIIWCTGYKISFPFFEEGFISAPGNDIALWKRMIDPRFSNLFFLALVQPLCAMMPIAEEQAKFIAQYLTGQFALPPAAVLNGERVEMFERAKAGYVSTPRHTIQINCGEYTYDLRRELVRGRKRAAAAGFVLPVPPRVVRPNVKPLVDA